MDTKFNYQGAFGEYLWRLHSQNSGLIADSNYEALNTNYNLKVKKMSYASCIDYLLPEGKWARLKAFHIHFPHQYPCWISTCLLFY